MNWFQIYWEDSQESLVEITQKNIDFNCFVQVKEN